MGRTTKNLLGAALLLTVGGGLGLYALSTQLRQEAARAEEARLLSFKPDQVLRIQLTRPEGQVVAERDAPGGAWRITAPVALPANDRELNAILNSVSLLPIAREAYPQASEAELKQLGLSPPARSLQLTLQGGAQLNLRLGHENKLLNLVPGSAADPRRVVLLPPEISWVLSRGLDELRSPQITQGSPATLTALSIQADGHPVVDLRKRTQGWRMQADGQELPTRPGVVHMLAVRLTTNLTPQAVLTDDYTAAQAERFGLAPPHLQIRLDSPAGPQTLALSKPDPAGQLALHIEGSASVYAVDPGLGEALHELSSKLLDRRLLRVSPQQVQRIESSAAGQADVQLDRVGDGWQLTAPSPGPADADRVKAILQLLCNLEVYSLDQPSPTPATLAEAWLSPPSRRLRLRGADGALLGELRLGRQLDNGEMYAQTADRPALLHIPPGGFQNLPPTPAGWRAR